MTAGSEEFQTPKLQRINDYVTIDTNNRLQAFNLGAQTFGGSFSNIMNGDNKICWVYNEQVLCDGNL
ncbi:hypothetical protein [Marinoscillum sp. MHG1-6]|uniref:hypothetical protein n=1 Tax=Marinoscillum sp. MHG1-6 TaxID=2959627 RepID=UPI00215864D7|nr:hypothetical protein [Marinoscillum sp. MHG1-6]